MSLPNFVILGAAKAGTTSLYFYLMQHPAIRMSLLKETNYLALKDEPLDFRGPGDAETINSFSLKTEADYRATFAHCPPGCIIGEATPLYLYSPRAPGEIKNMVPDAKLIAILRNPVDRAYSAFLHLVRDHRETTRDFLEALRLEPTRIADHWEHIWHYVAMGRYAEQLARYYELFPREQIKVYIYRDFRLDPSGIMADLFRFLNVDDSIEIDQSLRYNVAPEREERPPFTSEARQWIRDATRDDTARLEIMLNRDLSHWYKPV